jgi:hypothetical protein
MNQWSEAVAAFNKYRELLTGQPESTLEMKWCIQMIHKCRRQLNAKP